MSSTIQKHIATVADFVEHSTHWQEGGATRHDAKVAVSELPDAVEWIEKGLAEWRATWQSAARQNTATQATARIAIGHLQAMLNKCRTADEQLRADTAARDWLISIGSEPS